MWFVEFVLRMIAQLIYYSYIDEMFGYFVKIRNRICSKIFQLKTNSESSVYLKHPTYILGYQYIKHKHFSAGPGLRVECVDSYCGQYRFTPQLIIGDNVSFNYRCHIGVVNKVVIGDNVLIGSNVLITDHSHGHNSEVDIDNIAIERYLYSKGPVIIGENVWIGENVCILPNVNIGKNSIVGANSVVTKDIPPYSIVAGNPAKIIRTFR